MAGRVRSIRRRRAQYATGNVEELTMRSKHFAPRYRSLLIGCAIGALIIPWSAVQAGKRVHEQQAVDPHGSIDIVTVSGDIELIGWDRPEIEVSGNTADDV